MTPRALTPLSWLLALVATTACTDTTNLFEECVTDSECADNEVCFNQLCVEPPCDPDEIACGRQCVNPRIDLDFCGGCQGCPELHGAEPVQCIEGQCVYRCLDGFSDVDGDIERINGNGCECTPTNGGEELCDGLDNDCDGLVDDADNTFIPCRDEPGATASCLDGVCTLVCDDLRFDLNDNLGNGGDGCECVSAGQELCDRIDNDCDGLIDTDDPDFAPQPEVCDLVDNDCNGRVDQVDDNFIPPACELNLGVCEGAQAFCVSGEARACEESVYVNHARANEVRFQTEETLCDGLDNDCDGQVDELCCEPGNAQRQIATGDQFVALLQAVSNEAGDRTAVLTSKGLGGFYEVLILDEQGNRLHTIANLGSSIRGGQAHLHIQESTQSFQFVRHEDGRLFTTTIRDDGTSDGVQETTLEFEPRQIKTIEINESTYWLVTITQEKNIGIHQISDGQNEGFLEISPRPFFALSLDHVSFGQAGGVRQLRVTGEGNAVNSNSDLNRFHYIVTASAIGPVPSNLDFGTFPKALRDETGLRSIGSALVGDTLYRLAQPNNTVILSIQTGLGTDPPPLRSPFAVQESIVTFDNIFDHEETTTMPYDLDSAESKIATIFKARNTSRSDTIIAAGDNFTSTQTRSARHRQGVTVVSLGVGSNASELFVTHFNELGQPICPGQQ